MRLIERSFRFVVKHPAKNTFHEKIRSVWFIPVIIFDLIKTIIKERGLIDNDPVWNFITDQMFIQGMTKNLDYLYELGDSYRREVLGIN